VTDMGNVCFLLLQNFINMLHRYSVGGTHHSVPVRESYEKNMNSASETQRAGSAEADPLIRPVGTRSALARDQLRETSAKGTKRRAAQIRS
jgi:hypothetical protein